MSKKDYIAGRMDGLKLALRAVEQGGIEGLRKEIKYRGNGGVNTKLTMQELNEASQTIKENCVDTIFTMAMYALPFPDESFSLVIFDPPHLKHVGDNAWLAKKYGKVAPDWPQMLHDGFQECMRVLRMDGVLIFKWSEYDIPAMDVWKAVGQKPLFGHHNGKRSKTFWGCFMKGVK